MLNWLKNKAAEGSERARKYAEEIQAEQQAIALAYQQQKELADSLERRFPSSILPRYSNKLAEYDQSFKEDPIDPRWVAMLRQYPTSPQTERERAEREAQFWGASMHHFLRRERDSSFALAPRGEIQKLFEADDPKFENLGPKPSRRKKSA